MHYFPLYLEFLKLKIMGVAEYRKAFLAGGFAQLASYGAEFLLVWILMDRFKTINGWEQYEVLLLYAFNLLSYALASFFLFNPTTHLATMIKDGTFDEVLTKPLNSFLYLICREFNSAYISHTLLSLFVIGLCFYNLGYTFTLLSFFYLILVLIGGTLIQGAFLIITAVPSFWVIENNGLRSILFFQAKNFINYPVSIYNKSIHILLTFILPYAFINFFPVQYFTNTNDFIGFHPVFQYLTPVVGLFLFFLSILFWNFGINNYKSTGS